MKQALKIVASALVLGCWLMVSLSILVAAEVMTVDEEYGGLSDSLLNPYLILPYLLYTFLSGVGLWLLLRRPR